MLLPPRISDLLPPESINWPAFADSTLAVDETVAITNKARPTPDGRWVWSHALLWGRAVELMHDRFKDSQKFRGHPWDQYVAVELWAISMRQLIRVAESAKGLGDPRVTAAVAAFEARVDVGALIDVRDTFVHADEYAAGVGRKPIRALQVDIDPWTCAALDFRKAIAVGPLRPPGT